MVILEIIAVAATILLTIQGIWVLYTTKEDKEAKVQLTKPAFGKRKKICLIFPAYKDIVYLDKWMEWAGGEDVKFIIAEDVSRRNAKFSKKVTYLYRGHRTGFKSGAVNNCLEYIINSGEEFDYIMIIDADHIPYNNSVKEIYGYLNREIIQFFWYDGLPLTDAWTWITFSARYYSNWNIYNRRFPNLTGSGIAIRYDLIKAGLRFPNSITEDYALTLDTIDHKSIRVTVIPFVLCIGSSPLNIKVFIKQQMRWAEGTIRDGKKYMVRTLFNDVLTVYDKWDFLMHINTYMQGLYLITEFAVMVLGYSVGPLIVPIVAFQGVAYFKTLSKAPKKYWLTYFYMNYYMAFVQTYAFFRAIFISKGTFMVTEKTAGSPTF